MKLLRFVLVFLFMSHGAYATGTIKSMSETNTQVVQYMAQLNSVVSTLEFLSDVSLDKYGLTLAPFKAFTEFNIPGYSKEQDTFMVLVANTSTVTAIKLYIKELLLAMPDNEDKTALSARLSAMDNNYKSTLFDVDEHINMYSLKYHGKVY